MKTVAFNFLTGLILSVSLAMATASPANAQVWKNTPFDRSTWRLPERPEPTPYKFDDPEYVNCAIVNRTPGPISYSINGQQQPVLQPGQGRKHTLRGSTEHPPAINVSFDNGRGRVINYRLRDRTVNQFQWTQNGLDLPVNSNEVYH